MSKDKKAVTLKPATKLWFSKWPTVEISELTKDKLEACVGGTGKSVTSGWPVIVVGGPIAILDAVGINTSLLEYVSDIWESDNVAELEAFEKKANKGDVRVLRFYDDRKLVIAKTQTKMSLLAKRALLAKATREVLTDNCDGVVVVLEDPSFIEALDASLSLLYRYDCFRQVAEDAHHPRILHVLVDGEEEALKGRAARINAIMHATFFARDLINRPPSEKTPKDLANIVQSALYFQEPPLAAEIDTLLLDEAYFPPADKPYQKPDRHAFSRMGLIHAVARGSSNGPVVVQTTYRHPDAVNERPIVLVGKGVCFDSGGMNLKDSANMAGMKGDMAGAAAVFGIMRAVMALQLPVYLVAIAPLVYNMPSGDALKPDDVVVSFSGKSVEIGNTDAEGRLILADAISYAIEVHDPELLVDYATLTGACIVALGTDIAGVFTKSMRGKDGKITRMLLEAGDETGEPHWPLPLYAGYAEGLTSPIADTNNISKSRWGGAITAALFLKEFAGDVPWKHIDIAGPALLGGGKGFWPEGATGFGVRSGIAFLEKYIGSKKGAVKSG